MSEPVHADARDLATFGYKQELNRSLGSFSSFAAGFSYISILTGMFQTAALGFLFAGRAFIWAWPVVFAGQMCVALQFAELSAHYPLAGSVYQWSKRLAGTAWAWNTGWIYLCAQIVTVPAVALAWQVILPQITPKFQFIKCTVSTAEGSTCTDKNYPGVFDSAFAKNAFILGAVMIVLTTTVNLLGVRVISRINNIGVIAELIGAAGLILLLIINIKHGPSVLFETDGTGAGHDWGYLGALLLGAIMPLYVMYGFDTAGSLAEETSDPRRTAPTAVWRALLTAGVMGFLLIGFGTMAVDKDATAFGLTSITKDVLGDTWGNVWLVDVALAIFVCCLAIQAMSIRILFAMARDGNLPFARALASVSAQRRVPVVPALVSGTIALIILAFNIVNPSAFTIIVALGIILMYLSYLGVTIPLLRKRREGWPGNLPDAREGLFALRNWGIPLNVIAIIYGAGMAINLEWPRTELYVDDTYKWGPIVATAFLIGFGLIYYNLIQRHKSGVLEEHRAEAAAGD
jgi:urea carboxylase system permease